MTSPARCPSQTSRSWLRGGEGSLLGLPQAKSSRIVLDKDRTLVEDIREQEEDLTLPVHLDKTLAVEDGSTNEADC